MCCDMYVSPHLGDAVTACAGMIYRDRKNGASVGVLSLVTAGAGAEEQRAEDYHALSLLGASHHHLGLKSGDCPLNAMSEAIERLRPRRLFFPLGLETSPDHEALWEFSRTLNNIDLQYYEERPQAFLPYAAAIRLSGKGLWTKRSAGNRREMLHDYFEGLRTSFHARAAMPPGRNRFCYGLRIARELRCKDPKHEGMHHAVTVFEDDVFPVVVRCISAYRSLVVKNFGTAERYCRETAEYCRQLAGGGYAERYWKPSRSVRQDPILAP